MGPHSLWGAAALGLTLWALAAGCKPLGQPDPPGPSPLPGAVAGPAQGPGSGANGPEQAATPPGVQPASQAAAPGVTPPGSIIGVKPAVPAGPISSPGAGGIPALSVGAVGNAAFKITSYGAALQANKRALAAATAAAGASPQETAVTIAIAMQETTLMDVTQRDKSKDGTASANASILNMNYDFLQQLGYTNTDYGSSLNNPGALTTAVGYMLKAYRTWGIQRTLDFHRGGRTAFNDGVSFGAPAYRSAITTIYNQIMASPALQTDARRVEISVQGV